MNAELIDAVERLVELAPMTWLNSVCTELKSWPSGTPAATLVDKLPQTHNGDLAFSLREMLHLNDGAMSWDALSGAVLMCADMRARWRVDQTVELLWTGPAPSSEVPARRIDQALYDLISSAEQEILLITFAAHKIHRLADGLTEASRRGVKIRLLLEFEACSLHQLSIDALNAFPADLQAQAEIFYWPLRKRELNSLGKPGKLHAKAAVVDNQALLSSANLTDDAFLRNLELGVLLSGGDIPNRLRAHFDHLVASGTIMRFDRD